MRKWLAAILLVVCCQHAQAWNKHGYVSGNGAVLIDLNNGNTGPMFINLMKQAGCARIPGETNDDGYPVGTISTQVGCEPLLPPSVYNYIPSPNMVLRFDGAGAFRIFSNYNIISDVDNCVASGTPTGTNLFLLQTSSTGHCYVVLQLTVAQTNAGPDAYFPATVNGTSVSYTNMSGLAFYLQSYESQYISCADVICFDPNYLGIFSNQVNATPLGATSIHPLVLRMKDLIGGNFNTNWADWSAAFDLTAVSYNPANGTSYFASLWGGTICATSGTCSPGTTNAYVAAANSHEASYIGCVNGDTYQGAIADASAYPGPAAPTLTINFISGSCTAPIGWLVDSQGSYEVPGQSDGAPALASGSDYTFIYDATLNLWIANSGGSQAGFPPIVLAALCNAVNADCDVQMPTQIDDATVTSFAQTMASELHRNLKWMAEFSNEPFLFFSQQTSYFYQRAVHFGFPNDSYFTMEDGYAYRRYQVMNLVQAAWSAAGRSISNLIQPQVIAAGDPTANGNHNDDFDHEFAGIDLTLDTNGYYTTGTGSGCAGTCLPIVTNWSVSPYRPVDVNIDTLSYATYFGGLLYNWNACTHFGGTGPTVYAGWITASDNYATGVATSNPTLINSAIQWVDNDIRGPTPCNGAVFNASVTGTTLYVNSVNPSIGTGVVTDASGYNNLSGAGFTPGTYITSYGAPGCTPAGSGGVGCYTINQAPPAPIPSETMSLNDTYTRFYYQNIYSYYGSFLRSTYPNVHVIEYEGGVGEQGGPLYGTATLQSYGFTGSTNCPNTTTAPTLSLASGVTIGGNILINPLPDGLKVHSYNQIVFSQSGGNITSGTTYYSVTEGGGAGVTFGISATYGGAAIKYTGSEIFPQTVTSFNNIGQSLYCLDLEGQELVEGWKYSATYAPQTIHDLWSDMMSDPSSVAPGWYDLGGGAVVGGAGNDGSSPPQWQLINKLFIPPYTQTFYGVSAFSAAHPAYPYLLKRDLDPASNDNSPAFLDQAA